MTTYEVATVEVQSRKLFASPNGGPRSRPPTVELARIHGEVTDPAASSRLVA